MLRKIFCQGVPLEVDGEQIPGWQALGVRLDASHVEQLGVASLPQCKLMHGERGRERVPRLDKLGVGQRAWLPAECLNREAKHCPCAGWLIEPDLKLEARRLLAADSEDVGFHVGAVPALVVLRELSTDEAADD
jgi:hypothetical protein